MSRQSLIALVASVAVAVLAFWGVTLLFPAKSHDPIIGQWRIAKASGCSDAEGYMTVTQDAVTFSGKGLSTSPIVITAFESDAKGPYLRAYLKGGIQDVDFIVPYKIEGDTLTFQPSDWSPEAKAKFPAQIAQMDANPLSPGKAIYKAFQLYQPYHRCPG